MFGGFEGIEFVLFYLLKGVDGYFLGFVLFFFNKLESVNADTIH